MCSPQRDLVNTTACEHHEWPRINSSYERSNTLNNTYTLSALTAALWSGLTLKIVLYFLWLYRFFSPFYNSWQFYRNERPPGPQITAEMTPSLSIWPETARGKHNSSLNVWEREKKKTEETKRKPKEHHTMKDSKRTGRATCVAAAAASSIAGKRLTSGHRSQHGTSQTVKLCGATAIASQGGGRQPRNDSITATMTTNDML